ncbi:TPA: restriction endonuclease subunit S [Pseudomonas aeruginosa]
MVFDSVFPLHQDWEVLPLGEVCQRGGGNVQTGPFGSQLHASDYVAEGIPSVMPQNIGDNKILEGNIARITEADAQRLSKYRLRKGDIIYSRRGDVERRALVRESEEGWLCGTGCLRIRFGEGIVYPKYAAHYLGHPAVREWIVRHAHGATMPNLNTTILSELPFVLPPWAVQVSIGDAIELYDQKIDLNRHINQTLEAMAQAIFKSWFVDFDPVKAKIAAIEQGEDPLRAAMRAISGKTDAKLDQMPREHYDQLATTAALFPDEMEKSDLWEIPKGWVVSALGSVTSYLSRGISPKYLENGGVLVLNQKCIRDFRVDESKGRRHDPTQRKIDGRALELGDVLVNSTGVGTLGRVAQVLCLSEPTIVDSHVTVVRASHQLNASYLGQYIIWKHPDIEAMGEGSTGQTELSRAKLAELPILTPRENVLKAFNNMISPLNNEISANDRESVKLAELRDTLLPKLLSGELSVSDVSKLANTTGAA